MKLEHHKLLSSFAFEFNLRGYSEVFDATTRGIIESVVGGFNGRGLHLSTFHLNLSCF